MHASLNLLASVLLPHIAKYNEGTAVNEIGIAVLNLTRPADGHSTESFRVMTEGKLFIVTMYIIFPACIGHRVDCSSAICSVDNPR